MAMIAMTTFIDLFVARYLSFAFINLGLRLLLFGEKFLCSLTNFIEIYLILDFICFFGRLERDRGGFDFIEGEIFFSDDQIHSRHPHLNFLESLRMPYCASLPTAQSSSLSIAFQANFFVFCSSISFNYL